MPAPGGLVCLVSGGLDSVVLAHLLVAEGHEIVMLSVDYGQRHRRELDHAASAAARLGVRHHVADLSGVAALLHGSALTDPEVDVPDGHYAEASMISTVVPNRNAIILSLAVGLAVAEEAAGVAYAAHGGDHFIYPDCRPEFVESFARTARIANDGLVVDGFDVRAPFLEMTKADLVRIGDDLGVPFGDTWSCYRGGPRHCGRCGTCVERKEAFELAGVDDPTAYADAGAYVSGNV